MHSTNTGENAWCGKLTINVADPSPITFSGLSTKAFRTGGVVLIFPNNTNAARLVTNVIFHATIPANGQLRVVHDVPAGDAQFSFLVLSGGTNID